MEFILDIAKILLTFSLTIVVGGFLTHRYQRKNFIYQTKVIKTQKDIEKIKELSNRIETLAAIRMFYGRNLLDVFSHDSDSEVNIARNQYRSSVIGWNESIQQFFLELRSLGLVQLALDLERNVHNNIRAAHVLIDNHVRKKIQIDVRDVGEKYNLAFDGLRKISKKLVDESDSRWYLISSNNTETLNQYNLRKAHVITLIFALFHREPHLLRVKSSRND
jgi:hypothetical protein